LRRDLHVRRIAVSDALPTQSYYSPGLSESARILAVSPDGSYVATVADASAEVLTGNLQIDGTRPGPTLNVVGLTIGRVRQAGALGRVQIRAGGATSVHIVERWSGRIVARATHDAAITAAQFSPDGRHLVTTAKDGSVKAWEMKWGFSTPHDLGAEFCQV